MSSSDDTLAASLGPPTSADDLPASISVGQVLEGKFRVDRILGKGGMGVVVAATHIRLDEKVAIKFLLPRGNLTAEVLLRFTREARAAAKIKGEHVARVSDVGTLASGEPYMVMEYLQGSDLSDELKKRGRFPVQLAVEYVLQACEALAEAHLLGIVHRDLKPANLFLTRRSDGTDCIKILDFGISKMAPSGAADPGMTSTQATMGSPLYMSPEQMISTKKVDARSDLWSVGVVLYELLSGTPPFSGETLPEVCAKILQDTPDSLVSRGISAELDAVILRCLEKKPADRYKDLLALTDALAPFSGAGGRASVDCIRRLHRATSMPPATEGVLPDPPAPVARPLTESEVTPPAESRPAANESKTLPVLGVLLVAGIAGVVVLWQSQREPTMAPVPSFSAASAAPSAPFEGASSAVVPAPSGLVAAASSASASAEPPAPPVSASILPPVTRTPPKRTMPSPAPPPAAVDRRGDDRH